MNLRPTRITDPLTGSLDNFALDDAFDYFSLSLGINPTITGLTGWNNSGARVVYLVNSGANDIDIAHEDTNSDAANRIITPNGTPVTMAAGTRPVVYKLIYDPFASRWRMK